MDFQKIKKFDELKMGDFSVFVDYQIVKCAKWIFRVIFQGVFSVIFGIKVY